MFVAAKPRWNREKAEGGGGGYGRRNKSERERERDALSPRLSLSASEEPGWVLLVDQQLLTHASRGQSKRLVTK